MSLQAFTALALKETGLVRMRVTNGFAPHNEGEIAGFAPSVALALFTSNEAVPVDEKGEEIAIKEAAPKAKAEITGVTTKPSAVEIPAGWQNLHHLQLFKLVKELGGDGEATAKKEAAIAFIEAEEARRAAAQQQG